MSQIRKQLQKYTYTQTVLKIPVMFHRNKLKRNKKCSEYQSVKRISAFYQLNKAGHRKSNINIF